MSEAVKYDLKTKKPIIAQKFPYAVTVEKGKTYYWCACGRSKNQPFCDGSHSKENTGLSPKKFTATETKTVYLCGCKQTKNPEGFCDGTHKALKDEDKIGGELVTNLA